MREIAWKSLLVMVLVFSISFSSSLNAKAQPVCSDLSTIRVAMWHGQYSTPTTNLDLITGAALAPKAMMEWMGCEVTFVSSLNVLQGLPGYDILFVCGWPFRAGGTGLADQLVTDHYMSINSFVANGGIYIGLCGGSNLGCTHVNRSYCPPHPYPGAYNVTTEMNLFNGTGMSPLFEYEEEDFHCMVPVNIDRGSLGPYLSEMNSSYAILYNFGPYFTTTNWTGVHVIGRYSVNNQPAIIAVEKGRGCVVLCGPHPEWEEESDRDAGGTWDNYHYDPDSEWDLMKAVVQWCVDTVDPLVTSTETSTSSTSGTTSATSGTTSVSNATGQPMNLPLLLGVSGVGLVVVIALVTAYRRK
jgi:hypothetical protein